jgi:ABC-2 type transport system permease protein
MNTPLTFPPDSPLESQVTLPAPRPTRPMYWSVRRELWENRSIYIAPLVVTAVVLFGCLISTISLPRRMRAVSALDPAKQHAAVVRPFSMAPAPIMLATFLVAIFYCLDALHGERRERNILFWKSLPVSDRTTVLSKATIPFVVLPLIAYALSVVTQAVLLVLSTMLLLANRVSPVMLWGEFRFFQGLVIMFYGLTVHVLWFAPIYSWLLLVSAWARRMPVLWAAFPLFAIALAERIVFGTSHFGSLLKYRVVGAMTEAFVAGPRPGGSGNIDRLSQLDPVKFLSAPGLWIGLIFAAVFLAAAVRMRRNQEPI